MRPELHPACAAFPPLPDKEARDLANDIKVNGLLNPVTLTTDGLLLDGRCRWDACEEAGVTPTTVTYEGDDPIGFVLSQNRHRRHMTKSQLGLVVANIDRLPRGQPSKKRNSQCLAITSDKPPSVEELAKISGVGKSFIKYGRQLLDNAAPNIIDMVRRGVFNAEIAVAAAIAHSKEVQATWTADDALRIGSDIVQNRPSNRDRKRRMAADKEAKQAKVERKSRPPSGRRAWWRRRCQRSM